MGSPRQDRQDGQIENRNVSSWTSFRVTCSDRPAVEEIFLKECAVVAKELSAKGIEHYHVVIVGHDVTGRISKALSRKKWKFWSKRDSGTFLGAVSYTVKCSDFRTFHYFDRYIDAAPKWDFSGAKRKRIEDDDGPQPKGRYWQLNFSNLLFQAKCYRKANELATDELSTVLKHMVRNTRWRPSHQLVTQGLNQWYHKQFKWECSDQMAEPPDDWMVSHFV